jgi:hypothetical protein
MRKSSRKVFIENRICIINEIEEFEKRIKFLRKEKRSFIAQKISKAGLFRVES